MTHDIPTTPRVGRAIKRGIARQRTLWWRIRGGPSVGRQGTRILFYHRVTEDRDPLAVSPSQFAEQMQFLAREGYATSDIATLVSQAQAPPNPNLVGLCFDDGYADVVDNALPILKQHGFSATVFIATGVTSGTSIFTWYGRQPKLISWADIVRLDGDGTLRFEAHTVTHPNLLALSDDDVIREISDSKHDLESRLGRSVTVFCYPGGFFGRREQALVEKAGFFVATSCEPGLNSAETPRLALRRTAVECWDRLVDFEAKMAGAHDSEGTTRAIYRGVRTRLATPRDGNR